MTQPNNIKVKLTHYRCFDESVPVEFSLETGKTIALVGKNNAGKSALMRFFFEFKNALSNCSVSGWSNDAEGPWQASFVSSAEIGMRYGLIDLLDIYPNRDSSKSVRVCLSRLGHSHELEVYTPNPEQLGHSIHRSITWDQDYPESIKEFSQILRNIVYFGAHRNLVNEGAGGGSYFDLSVGTAFIKEWDYLKNGIGTQNASSALKAEKLIADLLGWSSLSINAGSDDKQLFLVIDSNRRYAISELGAGISELVLCIVTAAVKKPSWILIDEPESHLHPALQVKFVEALTLLATHGVMFTTHSVGLARTCADTILVVEQDKKGRSSIRPFEAVKNYSQLMGELSFSQFHELGFNKLLLCEGVTEVKTLRQILRCWGLDSSVMLIPLGGTALIDVKRHDELNEFSRFGVDVYVLVDSEKENAKSPLSDRSKFIALCEKLFGKGHAVQTDYRATENYFTSDAINTAMRSEKYKPLTPFERPSEGELFWGKNQNWRVAAEMTKQDWQKTDLGRFFDLIAQSTGQ